jgi:hypothetical protein
MKELICETCFTAVRDSDSEARLQSNPQLNAGQEPCMLCGTHPGGKTAVRINVDMGGAPICDVCVSNSR